MNEAVEQVETVEQPGSPLIMDHGDTRTVDDGQQPVPDGPSELELHRRARGMSPEPPKPEAQTQPQPEPETHPKAEKKADRWEDPDTGDHYDMRHRVSRRVRTLLSERGEARGRADRAEAEVARLTQMLIERGNSPAQAERKAEQIVDAEPDPANLEKYPEGQFDKAFIRDLAQFQARQVVQQGFEQAGQQARQHQERAQFDATVQKWNASLPDARKKYPDFDQILAKFPNAERDPRSAPVEHVLFSSPVGNDVIYILGTNEDALRAYQRAQNDTQRYRVLYHIEAQLMQSSRAAAAKTKQGTTAPAPTVPVNAAAGAMQQPDWSKDDPDQLQRWKASRGKRAPSW